MFDVEKRPRQLCAPWTYTEDRPDPRARSCPFRAAWRRARGLGRPQRRPETGPCPATIHASHPATPQSAPRPRSETSESAACARWPPHAAKRESHSRQPPSTREGLLMGLRERSDARTAQEPPRGPLFLRVTPPPIPGDRRVISTCARPLPGSRANHAQSRPPRPHRAHHSAG